MAETKYSAARSFFENRGPIGSSAGSASGREEIADMGAGCHGCPASTVFLQGMADDFSLGSQYWDGRARWRLYRRMQRRRPGWGRGQSSGTLRPIFYVPVDEPGGLDSGPAHVRGGR